MSELNSKEKIIFAAIEEFAEKGYTASSTNHIVSQAGISKGLLFHHFSNKQNLYISCIQHVIAEYRKAELSVDFSNECDYFQRLRRYALFKMQYAIDHPAFSKFMIDVYRIKQEGSIPEANRIIEEVVSYQWERLIQGVDTSCFKKGIPSDRVMQFIQNSVERHALEFTFRKQDVYESIRSIDEYLEELDILSNMVKYGVYEQNIKEDTNV